MQRQKLVIGDAFGAYLLLFLSLTACGKFEVSPEQAMTVTTTTIQMSAPIEGGKPQSDTTTTTTVTTTTVLPVATTTISTTTSTVRTTPPTTTMPPAPAVDTQTKDSQAKGFYTKGELINGVNLMDGAGKGIHKLLMDRKRSYGTSELVSLVQEMAQFVSEKLVPGQSLQVGDLSQKSGGKLAEHESHQNGLDADIVYISKNGQLQAQNEDYWTEWFVNKGKLANNFDIEKNWELVKWISKKSSVQRIFVDGLVKEALCKEASKRGELKSQVRALSLLRPENKVHQTHFHLRIGCPSGDKACVSQEAQPQESGCLRQEQG